MSALSVVSPEHDVGFFVGCDGFPLRVKIQSPLQASRNVAKVDGCRGAMADIDGGFYITSLMGMGVNGVTGDYSRGASGFWIEKGKITFPVSEMTIAGNLKDMFKAMIPANDLEFRFGTDAPTVRIDGMTVAGM